MPFKWVLLPTDFLLFLITFLLIVFVLWAKNKKHWLIPWRAIIATPLAVAALTICIAYLVVALLDSIHLRVRLPDLPNQTTAHYSPRTKSLLDILIAPLGQIDETTYSAPFASHSYSKETIEQSDGSIAQSYLPLHYPNSVLEKLKRGKTYDMLIRLGIALSIGIIIWGVYLLCMGLYCRIKHYDFLNRSLIAFNLTLFVIILSFSVMLLLSQAYHVLGTDKIGNDIFYASIKSIRTGLIIGLVTSLIMLPFAMLFGTLAGFFGGVMDDIIQYIYTTLSSVPAILLIAASILSLQIYLSNHPDLFSNIAFQADARLLGLCIILGITSWTSLCRLLRAETLKIREMDYIQAASVLGVPKPKILLRHILPNVFHLIIITVVLDFSGLVLAEAVLSYVGVGVDPTTFSFGNIINSARLELAREPVIWWPLLAAFIFMFILVLSANIFADALRDAFDPKLRQM